MSAALTITGFEHWIGASAVSSRAEHRTRMGSGSEHRIGAPFMRTECQVERTESIFDSVRCNPRIYKAADRIDRKDLNCQISTTLYDRCVSNPTYVYLLTYSSPIRVEFTFIRSIRSIRSAGLQIKGLQRTECQSAQMAFGLFGPPAK